MFLLLSPWLFLLSLFLVSLSFRVRTGKEFIDLLLAITTV